MYLSCLVASLWGLPPACAGDISTNSTRASLIQNLFQAQSGKIPYNGGIGTSGDIDGETVLEELCLQCWTSSLREVSTLWRDLSGEPSRQIEGARAPVV